MKIHVTFLDEEQEAAQRIVSAVKALIHITRAKSTAGKDGYNHVYLTTRSH